MKWLTFESETGVQPPKAVVGVYRFFGLLSLWIVAVGSFLLCTVGVMVVFKLINEPQETLYELFVNPGLGPVSIWSPIRYGFLDIIFASPSLLICLGIRKKIKLIYYLLYFLNSMPTFFFQPPLWPRNDMLAPEFRQWFFS